MNVAIIIAGGTGSRTGQSIPKQFLTVNEKPILIYTLEKFEKCNSVDEIYVTVKEEYMAITEDYIKQYKISKVCGLFKAGETRNKSISNTIKNIEKNHEYTDKIIIHHANMPFITVEDIEKVLSSTGENVIVLSSVPQFDYMVKDDRGELSIIDRNNVYTLRAPEAMSLDNALYIYGQKLVEKESMPPITVRMSEDEYTRNMKFVNIGCSNLNFKITTYDDFQMARAMILHGVNGCNL